MTAFVFPGQGSQQKGMGQDLFDLPEYRAVEKDIDELVGYSMRGLCIDDADGLLKDTRYTQPALYVVCSLHMLKAVKEGQAPRYAAGHSLGEYCALVAAGVIDFMTGLRLVHKRGELMGQARDGGMGAVIGLSPERIRTVIDDQGIQGIDVANYNSPSQTVISGPTTDIARLGPIFESAGASLFVPLPVSAAFHSRYMEPYARQFEGFLASFAFASPRIPVVANVTAKPYPGDAASIRELLVKQITQPVRWTESVEYLLSQGVTDFREVGPGNVLTRLVKQIQDAARATAG
ncbi:ACP S-malonyltransferase [Luteibacter sp. CQ10]|uniref:ACP S-malonyltransferase n=1 Tax=Luteibacter sp. CQ10 TaxID=2805821 RepID=UPI0034A5A2AD